MRDQLYQCSDSNNVFYQSQNSLTNTDFNGIAKISVKMYLLSWLFCVTDCWVWNYTSVLSILYLLEIWEQDSFSRIELVAPLRKVFAGINLKNRAKSSTEQEFGHVRKRIIIKNKDTQCNNTIKSVFFN